MAGEGKVLGLVGKRYYREEGRFKKTMKHVPGVYFPYSQINPLLYSSLLCEHKKCWYVHLVTWFGPYPQNSQTLSLNVIFYNFSAANSLMDSLLLSSCDV